MTRRGDARAVTRCRLVPMAGAGQVIGRAARSAGAPAHPAERWLWVAAVRVCWRGNDRAGVLGLDRRLKDMRLDVSTTGRPGVHLPAEDGRRPPHTVAILPRLLPDIEDLLARHVGPGPRALLAAGIRRRLSRPVDLPGHVLDPLAEGGGPRRRLRLRGHRQHRPIGRPPPLSPGWCLSGPNRHRRRLVGTPGTAGG